MCLVANVRRFCQSLKGWKWDIRVQQIFILIRKTSVLNKQISRLFYAGQFSNTFFFRIVLRCAEFTTIYQVTWHKRDKRTLSADADCLQECALLQPQIDVILSSSSALNCKPRNGTPSSKKWYLKKGKQTENKRPVPHTPYQQQDTKGVGQMRPQNTFRIEVNWTRVAQNPYMYIYIWLLQKAATLKNTADNRFERGTNTNWMNPDNRWARISPPTDPEKLGLYCIWNSKDPSWTHARINMTTR